MVKILTRRRKKHRPPRSDALIFSRDYVRRGWFRSTTYAQGRRGVILGDHKFLGRQTHVDLRLPDGEYLLEVPIDFVATIV